MSYEKFYSVEEFDARISALGYERTGRETATTFVVKEKTTGYTMSVPKLVAPVPEATLDYISGKLTRCATHDGDAVDQKIFAVINGGKEDEKIEA